MFSSCCSVFDFPLSFLYKELCALPRDVLYPHIVTVLVDVGDCHGGQQHGNMAH